MLYKNGIYTQTQNNTNKDIIKYSQHFKTETIRL